MFLGLVKAEVCWVAVSFYQMVLPLRTGRKLQLTSFNQALILCLGLGGGDQNKYRVHHPHTCHAVPAPSTRWQYWQLDREAPHNKFLMQSSLYTFSASATGEPWAAVNNARANGSASGTSLLGMRTQGWPCFHYSFLSELIKKV